jgi:hypothetical protein
MLIHLRCGPWVRTRTFLGATGGQGESYGGSDSPTRPSAIAQELVTGRSPAGTERERSLPSGRCPPEDGMAQRLATSSIECCSAYGLWPLAVVRGREGSHHPDPSPIHRRRVHRLASGKHPVGHRPRHPQEAARGGSGRCLSAGVTVGRYATAVDLRCHPGRSVSDCLRRFQPDPPKGCCGTSSQSVRFV